MTRAEPMIEGSTVAPVCPDCGETITAHGCWEGSPGPDELAWLAALVLAVHQKDKHGAVVLQTGTITEPEPGDTADDR